MRTSLTIIALALLVACAPLDTMTETVVFETTHGTITVELDREAAPQTVANFLTYVDSGHYNGTVFHRVIPGFMVQGGGFTPDGEQKSTMAPIPLESNNSLTNDRGTLAMARTNNPNSATSQFFVNLVDNDFLNYAPNNPGYAVFGRVTEGMDVVDGIAQQPTETRSMHADWPVEDVIIERAYIRE